MSRVTIHDKFRLINIIFSEELGEMALHSEDTATRAELDAGVIGHNSQFWKLVESFHQMGWTVRNIQILFIIFIHYLINMMK
jgi:hypothetical protein